MSYQHDNPLQRVHMVAAYGVFLTGGSCCQGSANACQGGSQRQERCNKSLIVKGVDLLLPMQAAIASLGRRPVPFAEDSTLASKLLAGTRGSAGALTEQVLSKCWIPPQGACLAVTGRQETLGSTLLAVQG